jgi:hypothetical protein
MQRMNFHLDEFEKLVQDSFGALLEEEGFVQFQAEATQYQYLGRFTRKGMVVQVNYSLKNDTNEVHIHRHPETIPLVPVNYRESSSLGIVLAWYKYPYSHYDSMMPYHAGGAGPSLKMLVEEFKKFMLPLVRGEEWISIEMVLNRKNA